MRWVAIARLFLLSALVAAPGAALTPAWAANPWELEAGRQVAQSTFNVSTFTSITFAAPFAVRPVVVVLSTNEGTDSSNLRIRNVTTTGFEVAPLEPPGNDGPHAQMTFDYIAMTPGVNKLPSGDVVVAGRHTTASIQRSGSVGGPSMWDIVSFGTTLSAPASVIASIQTMNSETGTVPTGPSIPWLSAALNNPGATNVEMALERSEVSDGVVVAEEIGYIAFPSGQSETFLDDASATINWTSTNTPVNIRGFDDGCFTNTFSASGFANARVVATKITRLGGDGGWLRRCSLTPTVIGLEVDEDVSRDSERNHIEEAASIIAFSNSFHATFNAELSATKSVVIAEDPLNGTTTPYAIPNARARYTIRLENQGNIPVDTDAVIFEDPLPPQTSLIVTDIGGGSGPIQFTDGAPPSTLTFTFNGLNDPGDDLDFSNDNGATFTYVPTPGADGADPAVTHIRIRPKGSFAGETGGADPNLTFDYDVILQ